MAKILLLLPLSLAVFPCISAAADHRFVVNCSIPPRATTTLRRHYWRLSAMDKAREFLERLTAGENTDEVSRLTFPPHRPLEEFSFYECFGGRGVRLAVLKPDFMSCSFKVPSRLLDRDGNLAMGAIVTLVDLLGAAVAYRGEESWNLSADMSISNISTAKLDDELEITARCLGRQGGYSGTHVLIRHKTTGEIVAEGRHSLFDARSKL